MPATAVMDDAPIAAAAMQIVGEGLLLERARRLGQLTAWISAFDDFRGIACSRRAVEAGAHFVDAWSGDDIRAGKIEPTTVMLEPPTESHMESSADIMDAALADVLDESSRALAAAALRACPHRDTKMPEAQILAEAMNLDSIGSVWLTAQLSKCVTENRPLSGIVGLWQRQTDYHYWTRRIDETLRFEQTRRVARRRVDALSHYLASLENQLTGADFIEER